MNINKAWAYVQDDSTPDRREISSRLNVCQSHEDEVSFQKADYPDRKLFIFHF